MVFQHILNLELAYFDTVKLIQELAWRDYWQQVWIAKGTAIDNDLKHEQPHVSHHKIPSTLIQAQTGIEAVDQAILEFYNTGYMHNHMRMYVASIACNIGPCALVSAGAMDVCQFTRWGLGKQCIELAMGGWSKMPIKNTMPIRKT